MSVPTNMSGLALSVMFMKVDFFERTDWMLTLTRRRLLLRCILCLDGDDEHSGLELVNESG